MAVTYPLLQTSNDVFNIAPRPGIGLLLYHLGRSQAVRMDEYRRDLISICSGVYVGEKCDGSLVYRYTSLEEHPTTLVPSTPPTANRYREPSSCYIASARHIIHHPNYMPFSEVFVQLGRMGAQPLQYFRRDIDVTNGLFIGKNGKPSFLTIQCHCHATQIFRWSCAIFQREFVFIILSLLLYMYKFSPFMYESGENFDQVVLFRGTTEKENPRSTINKTPATLSACGGNRPLAESPRINKTQTTLSAGGGNRPLAESLCVNHGSQTHDSGIEEAEIRKWFDKTGEEMENEWILDFDQLLRLGAVPSGSEFSLDHVSDDELDGSESQRLERARIDFQFDWLKIFSISKSFYEHMLAAGSSPLQFRFSCGGWEWWVGWFRQSKDLGKGALNTFFIDYTSNVSPQTL